MNEAFKENGENKRFLEDQAESAMARDNVIQTNTSQSNEL